MTDTTQNVYITMLAKGRMAELRSLADNCDDREIARTIYTEILQIARKLKDKHKFGENKREVVK